MNITETIEKARPIANKAFGNTVEVLERIWGEIQTILKAWNVFAIALKFSYIGYLIYALASGIGNLYANIVFLAFSVAYLIFDMTVRFFAEAKRKRALASKRRYFRYFKIATDIIKLLLAGYSVYVSWSEPTFVGIVLAVFSAFILIFDIGFEIAYNIVIERYEMLISALNADLERLKPIGNTAGAVFNVGKFILAPGISTVLSGVKAVRRLARRKKHKRDSSSQSKVKNDKESKQTDES